MTNPFSPPNSGAVLNFLLDAFALRHDDERGALKQTNSRRYLAGHRVSPEAAGIVHKAIAAAIVDAGLAPATMDVGALLYSETRQPSSPVLVRPSEEVLTKVLGELCEKWDAVADALRRRTAPIAHTREMLAACLRLVIVDLAVRLCAVISLLGIEGDDPLPFFWAKPRGMSLHLRDLLKRTEPHLSRDGVAEAIGVSPHTVDAWLDDDVRPAAAQIVKLTAALSRHGVGDAGELARALRLAYAARQLQAHIREHLGVRVAEELATRLVSYTNLTRGLVRRSRKPEQMRFKMAVTALVGALGRLGDEKPDWVEFMLNPPLRVEPDPVWRTSIRAARGDWFDHLQWLAARLGPNVEEELRVVCGGQPSDEVRELLLRLAQVSDEVWSGLPGYDAVQSGFVAGGGPLAATVLKARARAVAETGDRLAAIQMMRQAVASDPLDADAYFHLGAHLGMLGDTAAAIAELEISIRLAPQWDRPRVEIAIILLNRDDNVGARSRLEADRQALDETSPWLLLHLAVARERAGDVTAAIETYEEFLEIQPDHAEALDRLAHLSFIVGDKRRGAELAKRAAHLGVSSVDDARKEGYYAKAAPSRRPPDGVPGGFVQFPEKLGADGEGEAS